MKWMHYLLLIAVMLFASSCSPVHDDDFHVDTNTEESSISSHTGLEDIDGSQQLSVYIPEYLAVLKKDETVRLGYSFQHASCTAEQVPDDVRLDVINVLSTMEVVAGSAKEFFDNSADAWEGISTEVHFWISYGEGNKMHVALLEDELIYVELAEQYGYVYEPADTYRQYFTDYFNILHYGTTDVFELLYGEFEDE